MLIFHPTYAYREKPSGFNERDSIQEESGEEQRSNRAPKEPAGSIQEHTRPCMKTHDRAAGPERPSKDARPCRGPHGRACSRRGDIT